MAVTKTETQVAPTLVAATSDVRDAIRAAAGDTRGSVRGSGVAIVAIGGGTDSQVGDPVVAPAAGLREVRAPSGIVVHDAADMTVTVGAGTTFADLDAALSVQGQEWPVDPRTRAATVGGVLAAGLSGIRRLRHGPLRESVLEMRFVTGDGRLVQAGGPTVKNVSGYDLPRLLVGSLGTLGVVVQATLRCRPLPESAEWFACDGPPSGLRGMLFAPSSILWDGRSTRVLLEGHRGDLAEQVASAGMSRAAGAPTLPEGPHRGRVSVIPDAVAVVGAALDATPGCRWLAEVGVGTIHVACDSEGSVSAVRGAAPAAGGSPPVVCWGGGGAPAPAAGGWMLRESGAPGMSGFGRPMPNLEVMRRIKDAFDPSGVLSPGRIPL